jgi:hypothetical protein
VIVVVRDLGTALADWLPAGEQSDTNRINFFDVSTRLGKNLALTVRAFRGGFGRVLSWPRGMAHTAAWHRHFPLHRRRGQYRRLAA